MCRNHSHLIARFLGEVTNAHVPVLIYQLAEKNVLIESPAKNGTTLRIPTSGLLYLPSWALDGWSATHSPATEAPSMSVFFMPDDELTTMRDHLQSLQISTGISLFK
jgi:hypothetical protein